LDTKILATSPSGSKLRFVIEFTKPN
jgi:hypothetical protein